MEDHPYGGVCIYGNIYESVAWKDFTPRENEYERSRIDFLWLMYILHSSIDSEQPKFLLENKEEKLPMYIRALSLTRCYMPV